MKHEMTDRVSELVEFLIREMHARSVDEWRSIDLTVPQIKTLVLLQQRGPMRMGRIANYLGSTLSATTSIVDRLVDKGLVGRGTDPNDRRVVVCESTEQGVIAVEQLWKIGRDRVDAVVERLDVEQVHMLISTLEMLRRVVEEINQETQLAATS